MPGGGGNIPFLNSDKNHPSSSLGQGMKKGYKFKFMCELVCWNGHWRQRQWLTFALVFKWYLLYTISMNRCVTLLVMCYELLRTRKGGYDSCDGAECWRVGVGNINK